MRTAGVLNCFSTTSMRRLQVAAAKQGLGGTYTAAGLDRCKNILAGADTGAPRVVVLVTDGHPTL